MPDLEKTGQEGWTDDNRRTRDYFSANLERFGADVRAVDWGNTESQRLRFKVLAEVGELNSSSLLDVGCGMGDLYGWLKENNIKAQYRGIDITPEMTTIAKKRFPSGDFSVGNMLEDPQPSGQHYDFVIASGIFYLRQNEAMEYLQTTVAAMFKAARIGIAFNSLSTWFEPKEPGEFYADPLKTVHFCRTLTPWVRLRHDYHPRDFTVFLYRDRRSL
jgi:SAM-dependent methyltransferase